MRPARSLSLLLVLVLAIAASALARAQAPETGLPDAREAGFPLVAPEDDEAIAGTQVTGLTVAPDGVLYAATPRGLLAYDGARWRRHRVRSGTRSVTRDGQDRLWVVTDGEFGYVAPDSLGTLTFVSRRDSLPENARGALANQLVHFRGTVGVAALGPVLVRWDDDAHFRTWPVEDGAHTALIGDTFYLVEPSRGLSEIHADGPASITSTLLSGPNTYVVSSPLSNDTVPLIVATEQQLWRVEGTALEPFQTEAAAYLRAAAIRARGTRWLPSGLLAVATKRGGLVLLDPEGRLRQIIDDGAGLPSPSVFSVWEDAERGLWIGTDQGVAYRPPHPITHFDERAGLDGIVLAVVRHAGRIYAGTSTGLYRLAQAPALDQRARFEALDGVSGACLDLLSAQSRLLAACVDGTFVADPGELRLRRIDDRTTYSLATNGTHTWSLDARSVLSSLDFDGSGWTVTSLDTVATGSPTLMQAMPDGTLWIGTRRGTVHRVELDDEGRPARAEAWGRDDGLVDTDWAMPFEVEGRPAIGTKTGLYRYGPGATPAFAIDEPLGRLLVDEARSFPNVFLLDTDANGDVWYYGGEDLAVARRTEGGYRLDRSPIQVLFDQGSYYALRAEPTGTVWLGGTTGLFRLAEGRQRDEAPYPALVRQVSLVGTDSLLAASHHVLGLTTPLDAASNALRFEFAAPSPMGPLSFRYRLAPFEESWSNWSEIAEKEYTNLPPGSYAFEVQAEDQRAVLSGVGSFTFEIRPPWYATVWARLLFAVAGLALLGGIAFVADRRRTRLLNDRARALETAVEERTAEVHRQNDLLMEQTVQLEAQAEQLREADRLKSRFFANVSHEFRTPLTLTIGPLEDIREGRHGEVSAPVHDHLGLALRNARRVLGLINEILDVAKLEAGRLQLQASEHDLGAFVQTVASAFEPVAQRQGLTYRVAVPDAPVPVYFEAVHLEKVLLNILANAFKFTPVGGTIRVDVRATAAEARVRVRDSGPGIAPADLDRLFDRFYQTSESARGGQPGTGVGLALAKELTDLHGGTIAVESEEGFGSTFAVALPLGRSHLDDSQIAPVAAPMHTPRAEQVAHDLDAVLAADGTDPEPEAFDDDRTTVLVVEDNAEVRAYVRRHLEEADGEAPTYRVLEAQDGRAGLDLARRLLPDLVLSDVMMPAMDGFALCQALKSDPETDFLPVILLTARAAAEDKLEGLGIEADDYLTKPFDVRELRARIGSLIANRQRLRERFAQTGAALPEPSGDGGLHAATVDVDSADAVFLERVRTVIEARMSEDAFSVAQLAEAVGLSRGHLHRQLSALAGQTPSEAIRSMRLERSAMLLRSEAGTVSEVAYAVGFKSVAHFSNAFAKHYGCRPSAYPDLTEMGKDSPSD
ncbi:MAG: ATP-binding protein [Bacteroidota bacterium]